MVDERVAAVPGARDERAVQRGRLASAWHIVCTLESRMLSEQSCVGLASPPLNNLIVGGLFAVLFVGSRQVGSR